LDGRGASDALGAGGADLEAGIEPVEIELLAIGGAGRRPLRARAVQMEALDHLEEILRRALLVGEDEGAQPAAAAQAVVEAPADVGRAALLPALEDQRAHAAERLALRFERGMHMVLCPIEEKRAGGAALGADAQDFFGVKCVIRVEPSAVLLARRRRLGFAAAVERGPVRIELARPAVERLGVCGRNRLQRVYPCSMKDKARCDMPAALQRSICDMCASLRAAWMAFPSIMVVVLVVEDGRAVARMEQHEVLRNPGTLSPDCATAPRSLRGTPRRKRVVGTPYPGYR
jgi:hypothetical protein